MKDAWSHKSLLGVLCGSVVSTRARRGSLIKATGQNRIRAGSSDNSPMKTSFCLGGLRGVVVLTNTPGAGLMTAYGVHVNRHGITDLMHAALS